MEKVFSIVAQKPLKQPAIPSSLRMRRTRGRTPVALEGPRPWLAWIRVFALCLGSEVSHVVHTSNVHVERVDDAVETEY
jgi:hypothetical protein